MVRARTRTFFCLVYVVVLNGRVFIFVHLLNIITLFLRDNVQSFKTRTHMIYLSFKFAVKPHDN